MRSARAATQSAVSPASGDIHVRHKNSRVHHYSSTLKIIVSTRKYLSDKGFARRGVPVGIRTSLAWNVGPDRRHAPDGWAGWLVLLILNDSASLQGFSSLECGKNQPGHRIVTRGEGGGSHVDSVPGWGAQKGRRQVERRQFSPSPNSWVLGHHQVEISFDSKLTLARPPCKDHEGSLSCWHERAYTTF